jgi:hypothetical protein
VHAFAPPDPRLCMIRRLSPRQVGISHLAPFLDLRKGILLFTIQSYPYLLFQVVARLYAASDTSTSLYFQYTAPDRLRSTRKTDLSRSPGSYIRTKTHPPWSPEVPVRRSYPTVSWLARRCCFLHTTAKFRYPSLHLSIDHGEVPVTVVN